MTFSTHDKILQEKPFGDLCSTHITKEFKEHNNDIRTETFYSSHLLRPLCEPLANKNHSQFSYATIPIFIVKGAHPQTILHTHSHTKIVPYILYFLYPLALHIRTGTEKNII